MLLAMKRKRDVQNIDEQVAVMAWMKRRQLQQKERRRRREEEEEERYRRARAMFQLAQWRIFVAMLHLGTAYLLGSMRLQSSIRDIGGQSPFEDYVRNPVFLHNELKMTVGALRTIIDSVTPYYLAYARRRSVQNNARNWCIRSVQDLVPRVAAGTPRKMSIADTVVGCLFWLTNYSGSILTAGARINYSSSSLSEDVLFFCLVVPLACNEYLQWPDAAERLRLSREIAPALNNVPGIVGIIDCKL
jgi:hypothetical protein